MVRKWGHANAADNLALDKVASVFERDPNTEAAVRAFVRSYLRIGEDPTDTVVRDRVWTFLKVKSALNEAALDRIWREESAGWRCAIQ